MKRASVLSAFVLLVLSMSANANDLAEMTYGKPCGFSKSGETAYVVNKEIGSAIYATVKVIRVVSGRQAQFHVSYRIAPGARKSLGCTRGLHKPAAKYTYEVVGAKVL